MFKMPTSATTIDTRSRLIKDEPKTFEEEVEELRDKYRYASSKCIHNIEAELLAIFESQGIDVTNLTVRIEEYSPGDFKVKYFGPKDVLDKLRCLVEEKVKEMK